MYIGCVEVAVFASADLLWLLDKQPSQFDVQLVEFISSDVNCVGLCHWVYFLAAFLAYTNLVLAVSHE